MTFRKATELPKFSRICLWGVSGSGKTYSSLLIAKTLQESTKKPTLVIDTEHLSASKYIHIMDFDVADIKGPSYIDSLISVVKEAIKAGYKQIIIDSMSTIWNGSFGIVTLAESSGNKLQYWPQANQKINQLFELITRSENHFICTFRAKTQYEITRDDKGKLNVTSLGLGPIFRDNIEYEYDLVLRLNELGNYQLIKSRLQNIPLNGTIDENFGKLLI